MTEINMDKVNLILSRMNDSFWGSLVEQNSAISTKATQLTAAFMENITKLSVVQFEIVETKYKGYLRLTENKKKAAVTGIVKENKVSIDELAEQKRQIAATLTGLLAELAAIIEETQSMGIANGGN